MAVFPSRLWTTTQCDIRTWMAIRLPHRDAPHFPEIRRTGRQGQALAATWGTCAATYANWDRPFDEMSSMCPGCPAYRDHGPASSPWECVGIRSNHAPSGGPGLSRAYRVSVLFKKKGAGCCGFQWYNGRMKKPLTIVEFARMGGKARAAKLTKEELSAIGKKGGRPRKVRQVPACAFPLPHGVTADPPARLQ